MKTSLTREGTVVFSGIVLDTDFVVHVGGSSLSSVTVIVTLVVAVLAVVSSSVTLTIKLYVDFCSKSISPATLISPDSDSMKNLLSVFPAVKQIPRFQR